MLENMVDCLVIRLTGIEFRAYQSLPCGHTDICGQVCGQVMHDACVHVTHGMAQCPDRT